MTISECMNLTPTISKFGCKDTYYFPNTIFFHRFFLIFNTFLLRTIPKQHFEFSFRANPKSPDSVVESGLWRFVVIKGGDPLGQCLSL